MRRIKIYNFNTELFKVTGIQRVLMDIHAALKPYFDSKVVGFIDYDKIDKNLGIGKDEYIKLGNLFQLRNSVIFIHERKLMPLMFILTHLPLMNIKCVYVHHNELYGNKVLSLFPRNIVAISDAGIRNLTDYFEVPRNHIIKIHNCVRQPDNYVAKEKKFDSNCITILYPARINSVKQQIEIVRRLKGNLDKRIKIFFAGTGPDYERLLKECADSNQFVALGFQSDIPNLMVKSDFVMLFSKHEGLPISLIEAIMTGTPIICNDVGGNTEIATDGKNAFVIKDWDNLIARLNGLSKISASEYHRMSQESRSVYCKEYTFEGFSAAYNNLVKEICHF